MLMKCIRLLLPCKLINWGSQVQMIFYADIIQKYHTWSSGDDGATDSARPLEPLYSGLPPFSYTICRVIDKLSKFR